MSKRKKKVNGVESQEGTTAVEMDDQQHQKEEEQGAEEEDEEEEEDDEEMPLLKYHRMRAHLQASLQQPQGSQVTAICLHPRCLIVGTSSGYLHLLDYQGSGRELGKVSSHKGQVIRCISIDDSGEYVASCSDAGLVVICSLTFSASGVSSSSSGLGGGGAGSSSLPSSTATGGGGARSSSGSSSSSTTSTLVSTLRSISPTPPVVIGSEQTFRFHHPLYTVHIDPAYRHKTEKCFAAGGQVGQLLLGRKGFFSYREDVLHDKEGPITAIAWRGSLLAWANDIGIKVLDVENDERISFVERPETEGKLEDLKCHLKWESEGSLIIGWFDTVIILHIKARPLPPSGRISPGQPVRVGEIAVRWKTDCVISGLYPFDVNSIAILGYVTLAEDELYGDEEEEEEDGAGGEGGGDGNGHSKPPRRRRGEEEEAIVCRAEVQLRTRKNGEIFSAEILPLYGEERVRNSTGFLFASTFSLTCKKVPGPGLWRMPRGIGSSRNGGGGGAEATSSSLMGRGGGAPAIDEESGTGDSFMPLMVVAAPEDLVVARVRTVDDRILWVLRKGAFGPAIELALLNRHLLTQQRFHALAAAYLEQLMEKGDFLRAAGECPRLLGEDATLWERWIYNFASQHQLATLAPLIPLRSPRLNQTTYEMVLYHFLDNDHQAFFDTIRRWANPIKPGMEGQLYDLPEVTKRVAAVAAVAPEPILLEVQAFLHELEGRFEAALVVYWDLHRLLGTSSASGGGEEAKTRFEPVFRLIEEHSLFEAAQDRAFTLIRMNQELAGDLLVRYVDRLPVESVVRQLQGKAERPLLLWYLHTLFRRLPEQYNAPEYKDFHVLQVELYAQAAPAFKPVAADDEEGDKPYESDLLSFLMWSNHVRLETALAECQRRSPPLYDEMVYILGRIGHTQEALNILLEKIGSVSRSIDFVERHDKELWRNLTEYSLKHPVFLAGLLRHAGNYNVDLARELLNDIPDQMPIKGLKAKLLGIISSYKFERTMHECCKKVAENDWIKSTRRFHHAQRRAVRVDVPIAQCVRCFTPLDGAPKIAESAMGITDVPSTPRGKDRDLHIFSCKHSYHGACCLIIERAIGGGSQYACEICRKEAQQALGARMNRRGSQGTGPQRGSSSSLYSNRR